MCFQNAFIEFRKFWFSRRKIKLFWDSLQTHTKSVYYGKCKQSNLNIVGKINQFPDQFTLLRHKLASSEDFNASLFTENIFSDICRFSGNIKIISRENLNLLDCSVE